MRFTINPLFAIAAIIAFLVAFNVFDFSEVHGATRAAWFVVAFWQTGLAVGISGLTFDSSKRREGQSNP